MTPRERVLIEELARWPGRTPMTAQQFLDELGEPDGERLAFRFLSEAIDRHDGEEVEFALVVGFTFGFTSMDGLPLLTRLAYADWHERHEDVASALSDLASPTAVAPLIHLTQWIPDYLDFDDARALAVKAIWGLGRIGTPEAVQALEALTEANDPILTENAAYQLNR